MHFKWVELTLLSFVKDAEALLMFAKRSKKVMLNNESTYVKPEYESFEKMELCKVSYRRQLHSWEVWDAEIAKTMK